MSGTSGSCPAQQQQQQQVRILPEIPPTTSHGTLNVASFNTLSNWWYVFKYYHPSVPMAERLWQCRGQRMREYVLGLQADVICLQEVRPDTFEQDFQFLREAAYEMRMEKSNNIYMRCAIAWRSDKLRLVEEHKKTQRALIVTLETIVGPSAAPPADDDGGHSGLKLESGACAFQQQRRQVVVATCHLSAGAKPDERTRQLEGILKTVEKRYGAGKVGGKGGAAKRQVDHIPLILCGDFNSEPDEAARHFLLNREIGPDFVDRVYPEVRVTKKVKSHSFQLRDAYDDAYSPPSASSSAGQPSRPSTMIVKEIFGLFLREQNPPSVAAQAASTSAPAPAPAPAPALTVAEQSDELVAPAEHEITYTSGLLQAVREMFLQFAIRAPAAAAAAAAQATTTTTTMASNDGSGQSDTSTAAAEEEDAAAATRPLVIPASRVESWLTALHGPAENRDQSGVHHERLAREALLRHLRRLRRQPAAADNTVPVESATSAEQQPSATAEEGAEAADAAGTEDLVIDDGAPFASLEPAALTFSDFLELNIDELQRNPWSVMHDIQQLNVMHCLPPHAALPPSAGGLPFFERTYDYLYFTPRHFCLNAVRAPLMPEERATMEQTGVCLPNATVPSDHLPLECQLQLVTTSDTSSSSAAAADADGATAPCDLDSLTRAISERLARSSAPPSGAGGGKGQTKKNKQPKKKAPKFDAALLETLCAEADAWLRAPAAAAVAAAGAAAAGDADDDDAVSDSNSHRASNLETLRQRLAAADPDASGRKFEGMLTASVVHEFLSSSPSALKATADAATGKALQKQLARRISQLIVVAPVSS